MTDNAAAPGGQGAGDAAAAAAQGQTNVSAEARVDAIQNGQGAFTVPQDVLDWGKSKGYKPEQMAKVFAENPDMYNMANSYRSAEKLLGGEKLMLPKDAADQAGWDALYNKLGRPEKSADYKLTLPEATSGEFADWAKNTFHKNGLTQSQAENMSNEWNALMTATLAKEETEMAAKATKEGADLEREWGSDYGAKKEIATRATAAMAKAVGLSGADLDNMERTFGLAKSIKMMEFMGRAMKLDSDTFEGAGEGQRGGGMVKSSEGARAEKDKLLSDPAFAAKYNAKDAQAVAKIQQLRQVIADASPNYSGS